MTPGARMAWLLLFVIPALQGVYASEPRAPERAPPSVREIIERLTQPQVSPEDVCSHAVIVEGRVPREAPDGAPSIDLDINFEFASAKLTPDARILLDHLGTALTDPALTSARILIAGHTDARGNRAYNLKLSRERARAVADYLVRVHRIETRRLRVDGFGFSQLLDPEHPDSPVNRRVQISNLGS
jgi:outer membrane protein OmpA-like peptidoglycan-associated protein